MVRIRKTQSSTGEIRYYYGDTRITKTRYEMIRLEAKCHKKRCKAVTLANTQCKNCVSHKLTYWCALHEKLSGDVSFVIDEDDAKDDSKDDAATCERLKVDQEQRPADDAAEDHISR